MSYLPWGSLFCDPDWDSGFWFLQTQKTCHGYLPLWLLRAHLSQRGSSPPQLQTDKPTKMGFRNLKINLDKVVRADKYWLIQAKNLTIKKEKPHLQHNVYTPELFVLLFRKSSVQLQRPTLIAVYYEFCMGVTKDYPILLLFEHDIFHFCDKHPKSLYTRATLNKLHFHWIDLHLWGPGSSPSCSTLS